MGKLIHLLGAAALLPMSLAAQTIVPAEPAPAPPAKGDTHGGAKTAVVPPMEKSPTETVGPVSDLPSRYAGSDVGGYVEALATVFAIRTRTTDPFAQAQDTAAKPIKPKVQHVAAPRPAAIPVTPYSEIVAQIPVTTVIPGEGRFLVGTRTFKKGDRFPLSYRGRNYPSEVVDVSAERITLRNVENSETGAIKLDMLPAGMSKGGSVNRIAPGMQPNRPDSPLEVGGSDFPSPVGGPDTPFQTGGTTR
ncbi:hypothetical protein [Luteolibacter sp. LG18]|uniref:hypothetical protein n=1 Tax=Luteolibacter sp. LG18 TaxID=2819286 RepID=UPI002B2E63F4|nr:hypothetical protein llg_29520 [Luteolibacter sp. LG18]